MFRSSRRATVFAWTLIIALIVPILAACGGPGGTTASPAPAASTAVEASEAPASEAPAESEAPASEPADDASPEASPDASAPATGGAREPETTPINDKQFIAAFNQSPDTLFAAESQSSVTTQVLVGTGWCVDQLSYDYQPTYCFDEFPTFENGNAVTETVTVDAASISEDSPIVIDGNLITDTAVAEEDGVTIPEELAQLTLTWEISDQLYWEDGEQVTSDDVLESYRIASDPELQAASRYVVDRIASVEAVDDFTVEVTMVPGYLDNTYYVDTWLGFAPEHIYGGQDIAAIRDAESVDPVSFGPYMIEPDGFVPGETLTLVSNPYFQPQPNIGTVIFKFLADADQLLAQLESGEIDYAGTIGLGLNQAEQLETLEQNGVATPQFVPATVWEHIDFGIERGDGEQPFFDDVRVRQAVAYAINRQEIIDQVLFGRTTVMNTYVPADHPSYPGDDALEPYEFDPDRAAQLLDEAGWTLGADGVREKDGRRFSTSIYTTEGNRLRQATLEIIQQNLADVGIEVALEFVPGPEVLFKNGADGILSGRRFDMALYAWVSGVDASHLLYVSTQVPTADNGYAGQNNPGYRSPEFDAAAFAALGELDREAKIELDAEPLIIYNRDLPSFPLYQRLNVGAFNPRVTGIQLDPTSFADLYNIQDIDVTE
jgi:peptide/nickel transport system substrate-binding protein